MLTDSDAAPERRQRSATGKPLGIDRAPVPGLALERAPGRAGPGLVEHAGRVRGVVFFGELVLTKRPGELEWGHGPEYDSDSQTPSLWATLYRGRGV